jgi:hypothetical protein
MFTPMTSIEQLLSISDPWLKYAIRLNLLGESKEGLAGLKKEVLKDRRIQAYLKDVNDFHSVLVTNHKNPDLPIQKLLFLLDIGFDTSTPEIKTAVDKILDHKDKFGIYQSLTNIPKHFGGDGKDVFGWCLCDAPLMFTALLKTGIDYRQHIKPGVDHLMSMHKEYCFPCSVSEAH